MGSRALVPDSILFTQCAPLFACIPQTLSLFVCTKPKELDELDAYLADEDVLDLNGSILKWWKVCELKWPNLAKMVKQCFAAPCSGGGVERVFSAAGKMHGDLSKSARQGRHARALSLRRRQLPVRSVRVAACGELRACRCEELMRARLGECWDQCMPRSRERAGCNLGRAGREM